MSKFKRIKRIIFKIKQRNGLIASLLNKDKKRTREHLAKIERYVEVLELLVPDGTDLDKGLKVADKLLEKLQENER